MLASGSAASLLARDTPAPLLDKPGWKLTFHDEFDRPQLNDMYWFSAYRSGRKEYFSRIGHPSRWLGSQRVLGYRRGNSEAAH